MDVEQSHWVEVFWRVRGFCGGPDNPITPDILAQWERHTYSDYQMWQREWFFAMDRAFRQSHIEVLKLHASRAKVNQDDRDKGTLNGRRNPRI